MEKNKNITWTRAISCVMVIGVHTHALYIASNLPIISDNSLLIHKFLQWFRIFVAMGVPLFFMISGALLFNEKNHHLSCAFKRVKTILIPLIYFGAIYYFFSVHQHPQKITSIYFLKDLVKAIVVAPGYGLGWQLWYLYSVLPIYFLSAFIEFPKNLAQRNSLWAFILSSCFFFFTESIKQKTNWYFNQPFMYMVAGFFLKKARIPPHLSLFLFILFFFINITFGDISTYTDWTTWYSGIIIYFMASFFFTFIQEININKIIKSRVGRFANKAISHIALYSLGIYGWHMIVLVLSRPIWGSLGLSARYIFPLILAGTLVFSLLISMADTWFWARVRAWLAPLWQKISAYLRTKLPFAKNL